MAILPPGPSSIPVDPTMLRAPEHHYVMASFGVDGAYPTTLPVSSNVPLDHSTVRKSPAEEEMEDAEETSEWAVRIGNAPPPNWGKRKTSDDDQTNVNKRARLHRQASSIIPRLNPLNSIS